MTKTCCPDQSKGCCAVFDAIAASIAPDEPPEAFRSRMRLKAAERKAQGDVPAALQP